MRLGRIKSKYILSDNRLNSGFFLNENAINSRVLEANADKCLPLSEMAHVFNPPIFKRQFCQNTEKSVMYCQSSDVTNALEGSDVYINKVQAEKVGSIVKKNQILITGFGTIGNIRLVNELSHGTAYANNVCRVTANENYLYGYLYAFLSSKYGRAQLNKNSSGSVVIYIEAPGIKKTLVPLLPDKQQEEIHQLIVDAAQLRVEANRLLSEAVDKFENLLPTFEQRKFYVSNISQIKNNFNRLEATFLSESVDKFYRQINNSGMAHLKTISELSKTVFTPNIFKRVRVKDENTGVPFLSGSDLLSQMPPFKNFLSKKMKNIDDYILKEGWIAIQDSGTIGYVTLINSFLEGVSATNNLVRIVPNEENNMNYYIFCFFKTNQGQNLLKTLEYGSVQKHVDNNQISNFRIPIYDSAQKEISNNIAIMHKKMGQACWLETQAIQLIENEISTWQV